MVLGCEVELQPCFAGQLHFCPEQHSARRVGAFDLPEVDDIAGFDTGSSRPARKPAPTRRPTSRRSQIA